MKSPLLSSAAPCFLAASLLMASSSGFQQPLGITTRNSQVTLLSAQQDPSTEDQPQSNNNNNNNGRRSFLSSIPAACLGVSFLLANTLPANAGIDVSGLRTDGGNSNPALAGQLRAYDGSAGARVNQLKEIAPVIKPSASLMAIGSSAANTAAAEEQASTTASWLYRASPAFNPCLSRSGIFGNLYRYDDQVVAPPSSKSKSLGLSFEFPSDWLQLDKFLGGISYVGQRNGDRLWVLRTKLPEGERLATVPKSFFGSSIFDPKGTIVKSGGIDIDDFKVASATTLSDCPDNFCATHKRFKIKYATVTGNGLWVERRALVDAYEVSPKGDVYMLMTSSNVVKFEAKGSPQRETVEVIVDSFRIDI